MNPNIKLLAQFLVTSQLFAMLVWLLYTLINSPPAMNTTVRDVVVTVLYQIVPTVTGAIGFWIGSSLSSASKDSTISQVATKGTQ